MDIKEARKIRSLKRMIAKAEKIDLLMRKALAAPYEKNIKRSASLN